MIYVLAGVSIVLAAAQVLTVRWALAAIENTTILAAQERDALHAAHIRQLSEFANRIQIPDRAAHISISDMAPPTEFPINPEIEEELELIGES